MLNFAAYIGHTPLRLYVMGAEATERTATPDEIERMRALVGEAMDAGAIGFATSKAPAHAGAGGRPVPSRLADPEEIFAIGEALAERDRGIFAVTNGPDFYVEQLAELSKRTGRPVTWTALAATASHPNAMETLERQASLGGDVWPQVACRPIVMQITMADPFALARAKAFLEVLALPHDGRRALYVDEAWRERARADMDRKFGTRWQHLSVQETTVHHDVVDRPLAELAAERGTHPLDVMLDLALAEDLTTRFRFVVANEDEADLANVLRDERSLLGLSDAGAHASQLCDAVFSTYLLEHWVRDTGTLTKYASRTS